MKRKFLVSLVFSFFTTLQANNADCYYYTNKAKYFQEKAMKAIEKKDFCEIADYLELTVNYLGSAKNVCPSDMLPTIEKTMAKMSAVLLTSTIRCGH